MKALLWGGALLTLGLSLFPRTQDTQWTLLVGGSMEGYLSPCGCVKPMSGGIRRRAEAYRRESKSGRTLILELGPLTGGLSRQEEIKAETAAQALAEAKVDAIGLAREDLRLGAGVAAAISRLSGQRLISTGLPDALEGEARETLVKGPFVVGSYDPESESMAKAAGGLPRTLQEALQALSAQAETEGKTSILLLEGGRALAEQAASLDPSLGLIIYRSSSLPLTTLERRGRTFLATPGPKGKNYLKISFRGGQFTSLKIGDLGPEVPNSPKVQALFREYQQRVEREKLIEVLPRLPSDPFAGSRACISCHAKAGEVWAKSRHAKALKTLEDDGHARDPECVSCHVVQLDKELGFRSRRETPDLADVGCESCHGAGGPHSAEPFKHKMPKVGEKSCQGCHVPDHSPGFDFEDYWKKIAH